MLNNYLLDILNFQDVVDKQDREVFSSGGVLYYGDEILAPQASGNLNSNEIMTLTINLASGATEQNIYYPLGYNAVTTPKVLYSIIGDGGNYILGDELGEVNTNFFKLKFTRPIPSEQYYVQAFILKDDSYRSFSGSSYELNPIRTAKSLYVDSIYGHDNGTFSGRRQNPNYPYSSLQAAHDNALDGDKIYLYPGNYTGIDINKDLSLEFSSKAYIGAGSLNVKNNKVVELVNTNVSGTNSSGIYAGTNSRVLLRGDNLISTLGLPAIGGDGEVINFGNVYHNGPVGTNYKNARTDETTGIFCVKSYTPSLNYSGYNGKYSFNDITSALNFAPASSVIDIGSGTYSGFNVTKDVTLNFYEGVEISGQVTVSNNSTFKNFKLKLAGATNPNPALTNNATLKLAGESNIYAYDTAIAGSGTILAQDLTFNGKVVATQTINDGLKFHVAKSPLFSGHNNDIYFPEISAAIDYTNGNSSIDVGSGNWNGFSITNKPNLTFNFSDSLITSSINISGNGVKTYFNNLNLDTIANTGYLTAFNISSGASGFLKGDTTIRIPYVYSTGVSGVETFQKRVLASGGGSIYLGNAFYNQQLDQSITNLLGNTNGFYSGAKFFEPYKILIN